MTRKHFQMIADAIKATHPTEYSDSGDRMIATATKFEIASRIAVELKVANPRFDRDRFMEACGC